MVFDGVGAFVMVVDGDIIVVVLCDVSMAVVVVGSGEVDGVVSKIGAEKNNIGKRNESKPMTNSI